MGDKTDTIGKATSCYVEQTLKVEIPDALMTRLLYSKHEITSLGYNSYRGSGVEVRFSNGALAGTLVYYPGVPVTSLV